MADGQIFEEPRKSWLARLAGALALGGSTRRRQVRRESLNLTVPADKADVVRAAVEQWLRGRGIAAAVVGDETEHGKVKIHAALDGADAAKLDLSAESVQAELQTLLESAVG